MSSKITPYYLILSTLYTRAGSCIVNLFKTGVDYDEYNGMIVVYSCFLKEKVMYFVFSAFIVRTFYCSITISKERNQTQLVNVPKIRVSCQAHCPVVCHR